MSMTHYVKPDEEGANLINDFKAHILDLEEMIQKTISPGRSQSVALTKLQETMMWINRAVCDDVIARQLGALGV